ncbi:MAG: hypothetical protein AB8H47_17270 [Bacteroidia bacterium]
MNRASQFTLLLFVLLSFSCKDLCKEGVCPQEMEPPTATAFWGEIFPAIGAGCYYGDGKLLLFNLAGDQYALVEPATGQFDGPLDVDEAILAGNPFDAVGAVHHHRDGRLIFFNKNGTEAADYSIEFEQFQPPISLGNFGNDLHPFASVGVGAAAKSDFYDSFHFNQKGDEFTTYQSNSSPDYPSTQSISEFGQGGLSLDNVGAAIYMELSNRYIVIFDKTGTTYNIHDLQSGETDGYFKL